LVFHRWRKLIVRMWAKSIHSIPLNEAFGETGPDITWLLKRFGSLARQHSFFRSQKLLSVNQVCCFPQRSCII